MRRTWGVLALLTIAAVVEIVPWAEVYPDQFPEPFVLVGVPLLIGIWSVLWLHRTAGTVAAVMLLAENVLGHLPAVQLGACLGALVWVEVVRRRAVTGRSGSTRRVGDIGVDTLGVVPWSQFAILTVVAVSALLEATAWTGPYGGLYSETVVLTGVPLLLLLWSVIRLRHWSTWVAFALVVAEMGLGWFRLFYPVACVVVLVWVRAQRRTHVDVRRGGTAEEQSGASA